MPKLRRVNPSTLKQPTKSYSNGILLNLGEAQLMFVTGQVAQDLDGNVVAPNDAEAQLNVSWIEFLIFLLMPI